jgi:hypothetical protein
MGDSVVADFCKQCSIELFGKDFGDLKPSPERAAALKDDEGYLEICEGCGVTMVGREGECVYKYCDKHGVKDA